MLDEWFKDTAPTQKEAAHVLHFFDHRKGWQAGGFDAALLSAFSKADAWNFSLLSIGFPGYGSAMRMAQTELDGLDKLERIFEGQVGDHE